MTNTGNYSTGYYSTGYYSTGNRSTGNYSTGNRSTGHSSTGYWSAGNCSTGNHSTGDWSAGNCSTGNYSTGDYSTGNCSTGYRSTGYRSTGNHSTGNYSTGDWSTGDWSISNYSSGHFSTEDYSGFGCFDKPCTLEQWEDVVVPSWVYFNLTEWIDKDDMSEEEKKEHPKYATTGGYLKVYEYQEAFQKSYNNATREEQLEIKNLPNFDAEKFFKISGIKIDETKKETIEIGGTLYDKSEVEEKLKGIKPVK